ncbi:Peptidase S8, subtilisin-related [Trema orientale]|uniref:Peptidase S8, subtilisin-related n=1 Tax=Trema orientale TaxID=63057 RepID=A0A2P5EHW4_TREOI|nr:Peptidase S8, subtilisin-related [Trema orientale]
MIVQEYIVYMGSLQDKLYSLTSHHVSTLESVLEGSSVSNSLLRSYNRSFNGFVAKLTERERLKLASMKVIVSVFPNRILKTQTVKSWDFMGFPQTANRNPFVESDTIVVVIDSGIWPESESFSDKGFGPPPRKWKGNESDPFEKDPVAIGAFHAMEKGILTLQAGGNDGPSLGTISSVAPWLMSVAASNTDQRIIDEMVLRNGTSITVLSINAFSLNGTRFPLVHGKKASRKCSDSKARMCEYECLDEGLIKGKIVLCDSPDEIEEAFAAGALGCITTMAYNDDTFVFPLLASVLNPADYASLVSYVNSTKYV